MLSCADIGSGSQHRREIVLWELATVNQPDVGTPPQGDSGQTFSIRSLFALMLFAAIVFAVSLHWKLIVIGLALVLGGCRLIHSQRRLPFAFFMIWIGVILIVTGLDMFLIMFTEDMGR